MSLRTAVLCAVIVFQGSSLCAAWPSSKTVQLPELEAGQSVRLVWQDEFNGPYIDTSKWEIIGDAPRKDGYWLKEDAYVDRKGHLILRTKEKGGKYACGAIRTAGKFEQRYGYFEIRCKFHKEPGHWPAFWLMTGGEGLIGNGGRDGTEIDIMEKPFRDEKINLALHWDGYGAEHQSVATQPRIPGLSRGFHIFGLLWTPERYYFYVDGKMVWSTDAGGVCQVPTYVKITEEIGIWAGRIRDAHLPDYFMVDYVRVYALEGAAAPAPPDKKKPE